LRAFFCASGELKEKHDSLIAKDVTGFRAAISDCDRQELPEEQRIGSGFGEIEDLPGENPQIQRANGRD